MNKTIFFLLSCFALLSAHSQKTPPATAQHTLPATAQQGITIKSTRPLPFLSTRSGRNVQSAELTLNNPGDSSTIIVRAKGAPDLSLAVGKGERKFEIFLPEVTKPTTSSFTIAVAGNPPAVKTAASNAPASSAAASNAPASSAATSTPLITGKVDLTPVRKMTIYILPHSHNDIGYTEIQTNVERKQMNNLLTGIDYARRTKNYPAGARFVWNLEGVYAADLFLRRMSEAQRQDFIAAVKDGGVARTACMSTPSPVSAAQRSYCSSSTAAVRSPRSRAQKSMQQ
jgi:hypothetical protein